MSDSFAGEIETVAIEQRLCHVTEVAKGVDERAIPMPGQYRGATLVREKPRYVDVTIEGVGTQRVWF